MESWIYRLVDAPDELLARTAMYNRMINAPTSIVGHDDLEMYERAQEGLMSNGLEWVNIQRLYEDDEDFLSDIRDQRHNRASDAEPVRRLGEVHDRDDGRAPAGGGAMMDGAATHRRDHP